MKYKIYKSKYFPYSNLNKKFRNKVILGIGGNIGDVIKRFHKLFFILSKNNRFHIYKTSFILRNPPFGYKNQDDFYNSVIVLYTDLSAFEVLKTMLYYEKRFKRVRSFKNAPRTLDIDIIKYNNLHINTAKLTVPHKYYKDRISVVLPLGMINEL